MVKLANFVFEEACRIVMTEGRPLEAALCRHYFFAPCPELVLAELRKYQNSDGGFGHGLEPDFLLPDSSPLATSVAFQLLCRFSDQPEAREMAQAGIKYLESSHVPDRNGWYDVPPAVNNYPHTPWWHYNPDEVRCAIGENWPNPTVELTGYLYKFRKFVTLHDVDRQLSVAFSYLSSLTEFDFHDIYCYIRLHNLLPEDLAVKIRGKITEAVSALVSANPEEWDSNYVPKPMDFVGDSQFRFGLCQELLEANYKYAIEKLGENRRIFPSWGKKFYVDGLENSWSHWVGIGTLKTLTFLAANDQIER